MKINNISNQVSLLHVTCKVEVRQAMVYDL